MNRCFQQPLLSGKAGKVRGNRTARVAVGRRYSGPSLLLALPMRLAWQFWVGVGMKFRSTERWFDKSWIRDTKSHPSRKPWTTSLGTPHPTRQATLIEAELLHPLTLSHFLLPRPADSPLSAIMALPLILIGFPFMLFMEYLLIRQRLLILALKTIERLLHWQVIHIPKPHRGNKEQRRSLTEFSHTLNFNYVPQAAFLGLFAWLIVHWVLDLDSWTVELIVSSLLYMVLLSILSVLNTALEADLVFVDPAKGRLVPVNQWLEGVLNPVVGIGCCSCWAEPARESRDVDGNPILFATVVLTLLYGAAIVGISYRWGIHRGVEREFVRISKCK